MGPVHVNTAVLLISSYFYNMKWMVSWAGERCNICRCGRGGVEAAEKLTYLRVTIVEKVDVMMRLNKELEQQ